MLASRIFFMALAGALLGWTSPAAAQSTTLRDFELPPSADQPSGEPRVQGPVDPEAPVVSRPRAIATPTPAPTRNAAPAPTPTIVPEPLLRPETETRAPPPRQPPVRPSVNTAPPALDPPQTRLAPPSPALDIPAPEAPPAPQTDVVHPPAPASTEPTAAESSDDESAGILPFLIGFAVLAIGAGVVLFMQRRASSAPVPVIERPVPAKPPSPVPAAAQAEPGIAFEPLKLTRSFMFTTLDYRLVVRDGATPLDIGISLSSARSNGSGAMHSPRIEANHIFTETGGETPAIQGRLQLANADITPIRQGNGAIMLPLVEITMRADDGDERRETYVVGQSVEGRDRLQPFRFDGPPRSWDALSSRKIDQPSAALPTQHRPLDAAAMAG